MNDAAFGFLFSVFSHTVVRLDLRFGLRLSQICRGCNLGFGGGWLTCGAGL